MRPKKYRNFMNAKEIMEEYIKELEKPIKKGKDEPLKAAICAEWIHYKALERGLTLTDEQIEWIIQRLETDRCVETSSCSIECTETGRVLKEHLTYDEAAATIQAYEMRDREEGTYKEGCYSIWNANTSEHIVVRSRIPNTKDLDYYDFMEESYEYIVQLEERNEVNTTEEWRTRIESEMLSRPEEGRATPEQIGWILDKLEEDGLVIY